MLQQLNVYCLTDLLNFHLMLPLKRCFSWLERLILPFLYHFFSFLTIKYFEKTCLSLSFVSFVCYTYSVWLYLLFKLRSLPLVVNPSVVVFTTFDKFFFSWTIMSIFFSKTLCVPLDYFICSPAFPIFFLSTLIFSTSSFGLFFGIKIGKLYHAHPIYRLSSGFPCWALEFYM